MKQPTTQSTVTASVRHLAVIVTGTRHGKEKDWGDTIFDALSGMSPNQNDAILIHGDCEGIDTIAKEVWAKHWGDDTIRGFPADWRPDGPAGRLDRSAGPRRNREMLTELLKLRDAGYEVGVFAFHHDLTPKTGTHNMVKIAKAADVPVRIYRGGA